jgi:hypothetical protein
LIPSIPPASVPTPNVEPFARLPDPSFTDTIINNDNDDDQSFPLLDTPSYDSNDESSESEPVDNSHSIFNAAHVQLKKNFLSFMSSSSSNIPSSIASELTSLVPITAYEPNLSQAAIADPSEDVVLHLSRSPSAKKKLFPSFHCHTVDDLVHLRLMNLCQDIGAPLYAFDSIMNWAHDAKSSGYQFPTDAPSRRTYLDRLYTQFNMHNIKPFETEVPLFPDKLANVVTFSFQDMALSLLSDESLMQPENLLWNTIHEQETHIRSDINSGSWFKQASIKLCLNGKDVLCPIILFIDKTVIDTFSKWTLEPVLFTLGIFNLSTRNLSNAWRPLGLVTNTIRMSSAENAELGKQVRILLRVSILF